MKPTNQFHVQRELTIGDASDVKEIKFSLMQYIELIIRNNMESKPTEDCPASGRLQAVSANADHTSADRPSSQAENVFKMGSELLKRFAEPHNEAPRSTDDTANTPSDQSTVQIITGGKDSCDSPAKVKSYVTFRVRCMFYYMGFTHVKSIKSHMTVTGFHNKFMSVDPGVKRKRQIPRCPLCNALFRNMDEFLVHNGPSKRCYRQKIAEQFCSNQFCRTKNQIQDKNT